jgi:HEAT repeat protein
LGSFETASGKPSAEQRVAAQRLMAELGAGVVAPLSRLASHPDPDLRLVPIPFLVTRHEERALRALETLTRDSDLAVRRAVLSALGPQQAGLAAAVAARLEREPEWPLRATAAEALGRMAPGAGSGPVAEALSRVALSDTYALVREAATRALVTVSGAAAVPTLHKVRTRDAEPRLRALAERLSNGLE